jgi:hypothetical protein
MRARTGAGSVGFGGCFAGGGLAFTGFGFGSARAGLRAGGI